MFLTLAIVLLLSKNTVLFLFQNTTFRRLESVSVFRSLSPEIMTSSVYWAQLSGFYLKTETETSLRSVVFRNKNRTMDNVPKHNICIVKDRY
jgi:hypothetical protein